MATHNDSGRLAEQEAARWLESRGYTLLETNYRYQHAEIDLIMTHQGLLIFIEVKFRSGVGFGFAEEFVHATKRNSSSRPLTSTFTRRIGTKTSALIL